jgi:hypothetical protein
MIWTNLFDVSLPCKLFVTQFWPFCWEETIIRSNQRWHWGAVAHTSFMVLTRNSVHFGIQHLPIVLYNESALCCLWGVDWIFRKNIILVFKFHAVAQAGSRRAFSVEAPVRFQVNSLWWRKWHWDRFFSVSMIPPILLVHIHLHVALTRRTNWRSLVTSHKEIMFRKSEELLISKCVHFFESLKC